MKYYLEVAKMVSSSPETFDELGGEHLILKHVIVL